MYDEMLKHLDSQGLFFLILAIILMPLNWLVEALKWQLVLQPIRPSGLWWAVKSVCAGVSIGIFMPNRIGEFTGKILLLPQKYRLRAGMAAILTSIAQFAASVAIGAVALLLYLLHFGSFDHSNLLLSISAILILILVLSIAYFSLPYLFRKIGKLSWTSGRAKLQAVLSVSTSYHRRELILLWLLAAFRYLIFSFQFVFLLYAMGIDASWIMLWILVASTLLLQSLIPVPAMIALGIRFSAAIYFIGQISGNEFGIIAASAMLWIINLIVPALAGLIFINRTKIWERSS